MHAETSTSILHPKKCRWIYPLACYAHIDMENGYALHVFAPSNCMRKSLPVTLLQSHVVSASAHLFDVFGHHRLQRPHQRLVS